VHPDVQICHPASQDTSDVLFQDDFESGFSKWHGFGDSSAPVSAVISKAGAP
jgi:hypothetical protein